MPARVSIEPSPFILVSIADADTPDALIALTATIPSQIAFGVEDRDHYQADEEAIYAALTLRFLKNRHTVQWRWIDPSGHIYVETQPTPVGRAGETYKDITVFHRMRLKGEAAMRRAGIWTVEAVLYQTNGNLQPMRVRRPFHIDPAPVPVPALLPMIIELRRVPFLAPRIKETASSEEVASVERPERAPQLPVALTPNSVPEPLSALPEPVSILFHFGKTALSTEAQAILRDKVSALKKVRRILVRGYHDSTGLRAFNQSLSQKRAEAVAAFLIAQGIPTEKIMVKAELEVYLVPNDTREHRRQNRRVIVEGTE